MSSQGILPLSRDERAPTKSSHTSDQAIRTLASLIQEDAFEQILRLERRRSERSGKQFMLVLISGSAARSSAERAWIHRNAATSLTSSMREIDILGWYEKDSTLGLLVTEVGNGDTTAIDAIKRKILAVVGSALGSEGSELTSITFHMFPQEIDKKFSRKNRLIFLPEPSDKRWKGKKGLRTKRLVDILGSLVGLILFLPALIVIGVLVKLTSEGPMLFFQRRVGQHGKEFQFMKFRTMYVNNDPAIHREYVSKFIDGKGDTQASQGMFKLTNDPRVTPMGRILRKTSLDELPQFLNVLLGSMSLVGPRPPLPYEYERYKPWHKRRVLELKPGITGLWQVSGRSLTTFDEMVRLDIRYANTHSFWTDLKILFSTPSVMISGRGAC